MTSPVYIDDLRAYGPGCYHGPGAAQAARVGARNGHRWCHLWTDPGHEAALHRLAERIGLRRAWFQAKPGFPHYDCTEPRATVAIAHGAVPTSLRAWMDARRRRPALASAPPTSPP